MNPDMLQPIDGDPEAERREIEAPLSRAYAGEADSLLEEVEELVDVQTWPND